MSAEATNPYATPRSDVGTRVVTSPEAVEIRRAHIRHEASVRSVGTLYYVSTLGFVGIAFVGLLASTSEVDGSGLVMIAVGAVGAAALGWCGYALRRLDPRARLPVGLLSGLGLLNVPVGTLINGYILYLVFGEKGKMVFSEDYRDVMDQTPDVRYETPMIVKVIAGLLLALVVGGMIAAIVQG